MRKWFIPLAMALALISDAMAQSPIWTRSNIGVSRNTSPPQIGVDVGTGSASFINMGTVSGGVYSVPLSAIPTIPSTRGTFTASGVGGVTQSMFAKFSQVLSAVDYGADPTGATDSCTAITNAVAALPAGSTGFGGSLYFPNGTYISSCALVVTDKLATIVGSGNGASQITFTSAASNAAGVRFVYSTPYATLAPTIRDIALASSVDQVNGNACVSITRPSASLSTFNSGPFISNVSCGAGGSTYWADGVVCYYCTFLSMQKVQIIGKAVNGATTGTNMSRGVYLNNTIDANIYDTHVYFANKGVSLDADSEGLKLAFSSFVMTDWGVYTEAAWAAPSVVISDTHFNVTTGGIHIQGGGSGGQNSQGQISNNLIYRWTSATAAPWTAIECLNGTTYACKDFSFRGNNIMAFKGLGSISGEANCFKLGSNTVNVAIHDNTCRDADYFADMGSSTSGTITVYNNHGIGSGNVSWQRNQNPSAVWRTNDPALFGSSDTISITQGLNATVWNLAGAPPTSFLTNANAATTVTDGNGGWPGLIVSVRCADTNTSISNGTGGTKFALSGGSTYTCPRVGATINFMYSDQWREIGRAG